MVAKLLSLDGKTKPRANKQRFFSTGLLGDYVVGRWACLRGRNKQVIADIATKEMTWNELPDGYEITAPNYFVFHRETFHGLYQRYANSNPFRLFTDMLRSVAVEVRAPLLKAALEEPRRIVNANRKRGEKRRDVPEHVKRDIYERYAVNSFPLLRREKLEELLARWKSIKAVKYQVATVGATADQYGPMAEHTRAEVRELRFEPKADRGPGFVSNIVGMCAWLTDKFKSKLRRTSLIGLDEGSHSRTVSIDKFVDWLGEDDLGNVLTDKELDNKDVVQSELVARMLALCKERPEYFQKAAL
ncbi:MAG TPA: hypothetical protein VGE74_18410 [Gemmata sp.]